MDYNPTEFTFNEVYEQFKEVGHFVSASELYVGIFGEKIPNFNICNLLLDLK